MNCPICKSSNVRNFFVDDMLNELTPEQLSGLTEHEKEIAAESECLDCFHSEATEYFERTDDPNSGNEHFDLFEAIAMSVKPWQLC